MLNKVTLQGRLGQDPEVRQTTSGKSVTSFSLAVDRDIKGQDGKYPTDWIPVVAWNKTAEFVERYFHKGDSMIVLGRLTSRNYEDKQGNKRTAYEVIADNVYFCGGRQSADVQKEPQADSFAEVDDDDIPF